MHRAAAASSRRLQQRCVLGGGLAHRLIHRALPRGSPVPSATSLRSALAIANARRVVAPDRPHHHRGHQHVAAEVGGVGREPRHELLARRRAVRRRAPVAPAAGTDGGGVTRRLLPHRGRCVSVEKREEVGGEDLVARERRERTCGGGDAGVEGDGLALPGCECERVPGE